MGDSTAMTIEFLRARLLSERTVSRTARQRAEQLAKRVAELEEQLRIMVTQRKKAEKAAAEVLSILENRDIGDFSEVIDSSSDQDDDRGESKGNDFKEDDTSTASRAEKSEVEDELSGSEPEVSPARGRSLSWKGRSSSPGSHEKQKIKQIRQRQRQSSFTSVPEPSGKLLLGKSCRKIRRRETRSTAKDDLVNLTLDEHGERGASWSHDSHHSEEHPECPCPQEASKNEMEEVFRHTSVTCSLDSQIKETDGNLYTDRRDRDEEMERVLEQQAQLIGQYQAEENAQREWEEKYNENESSNMFFVRPGIQHDTAEICSEPKEAATELAGKNMYLAEDSKSSAKDVPNIEEPTAQRSSNAYVPTVQTPHAIDPEKSGSSNGAAGTGISSGSVLPDQTKTGGNSCQAFSDGVLGHQYNGILILDTESSPREFAFPAQESSNMSNSSIRPHGNGIPGSPSSESPASSVNSALDGSRPQSSSGRLGGVLQALQHAKVSLGHLSELPLSNPGTLATVAPTDSQVRTHKYGGDLDIPIGTTGLFRLPTDSYPQADFLMPKFYGSGLSSRSTYPDVGYAISQSEHQYPTTTYVESGSRVSAGRQYFDPYLVSGTRRPVSTRYPMSAERASTQDGYPMSGIDLRNELASGTRVPALTTRYSLPYSHLAAERNSSQYGYPVSGMYLRNELASGDRYNVYGSGGALTDIQRL